jgi:HSP20 family molecular chaperone IbpA
VRTHDKSGDQRSRVTLPLGLDGLFRGISNVLQMASDIAEKVPEDASGAVNASETGSIGLKGLRAIYGASVRIGPRVAPKRRPIVSLPRTRKRAPIADETGEPMADVHDEGDHYLVVAELPGAAQAGVHWEIRDGHRLVIKADAAGRKYRTELPLAEQVDETRTVSCYANGVLELRLWKRLHE